jgi:hypothetical protein
MVHPLTLEILPEELAVCRLPADAALPDWGQQGRPYAVVRTADELSIVCCARLVPADVQAVRGWRCFRVRGPLPFHLTGILAKLTNPLAEAGIALFALSTFDTDYVLVEETRLAAAVVALRQAGHDIDAARTHGGP